MTDLLTIPIVCYSGDKVTILEMVSLWIGKKRSNRKFYTVAVIINNVAWSGTFI